MKIDLDFMKSVFSEALELSLEKTNLLTLNSMFEEVEGWDSMGHMRIVMELEDRLDVEFEIDEVVGVDTIEKLIEMAEKKL